MKEGLEGGSQLEGDQLEAVAKLGNVATQLELVHELQKQFTTLSTEVRGRGSHVMVMRGTGVWGGCGIHVRGGHGTGVRGGCGIHMRGWHGTGVGGGCGRHVRGGVALV